MSHEVGCVFNGSGLNSSSPSFPYCLLGLTCLTPQNLILAHCHYEHRFFFSSSNLNLRKCHFPTFRTYNFRTRVFLNHGKQEACPSLHSGTLPHNRRLRISSTQPSNSRLDQRTVSGIWSCSWRACLHTSCYTQSHRNL